MGYVESFLPKSLFVDVPALCTAVRIATEWEGDNAFASESLVLFQNQKRSPQKNTALYVAG